MSPYFQGLPEFMTITAGSNRPPNDNPLYRGGIPTRAQLSSPKAQEQYVKELQESLRTI